MNTPIIYQFCLSIIFVSVTHLQALPYGVSCAVRVDRNGDVAAVMAAVRALAIACNTPATTDNNNNNNNDDSNNNNNNDNDTTQQQPSHPPGPASTSTSGSNVNGISSNQQGIDDNIPSSSSSSSSTTARAPSAAAGPALGHGVTTLDGVDEHTLFVPAEVHHLRPKVLT